MGLVGFAVDLSWFYFKKEVITVAAQAAAMAGATQVYKAGGSITCNSGVAWCNSTPQACASSPTNPPTNSFDTACLYAQANGYTNGGRKTVTVAATTTTGTSNVYSMTVKVTEQLPPTFLSVVGAGSWTTIAAQASGGVNASSGGGCIYVLDPTMQKAFPMTGATFSTGCGIYVNSNQSNAFFMSGGTLTLTSGAKVKVHGGFSTTGGTVSPSGSVLTSQSSVSDPMSGMTAPTPAASCLTDPNITGGSGNVISPGTYCGITVKGGTNTQFQSGIYILKTGNLKISGGTFSSTAPNVLFYIPASNTTGKISITCCNTTWNGLVGNGADGVVFWVANSAAQTVTGGSYSINGVYYMPSAALTYTGGTGTTQTIIADSLTVTGGTITSPASSSYFTGTTQPGGAFLVP
jgi:hypothetical protein